MWSTQEDDDPAEGRHLQVTSPGAKQVGPASLTSKRRETEAELTMGGTWAWVAVAAALGRERRVSQEALCPACVPHFSKPQSPAWRAPAKADHSLPCYQHCHLSHRHTRVVLRIPRANPAFSPKATLLGRAAHGASLRPR